MLAKLKIFIKEHLGDIILLIGVILISLLSFAIGFIVAKQQEKEPLRLEMNKEQIAENKKENKKLFSVHCSLFIDT